MSFYRKDSERAFVVEFIKLYRDLPVLWDVKCKQYRNRFKKRQAYDVLVKKYREVYPQATRIDVKKKINILRTNYRKEYRKYTECLKTSPNPESVRPTLWYYDEFSFLNDLDENASEQESPSMDDKVQNIYLEDSEEYNFENQSSSDENKDQYLNVHTLPRRSSSKRPKIERHEDVDLFNSHTSDQEDFHHWALACAEDLRKMEREQQIYAKRAIAEIIMKGELGQLTGD